MSTVFLVGGDENVLGLDVLGCITYEYYTL